MRKLLSSLVTGLALATIIGTTATAATCASRDQLAQQLKDRFGEVPHSKTLDASDAVVEVFASPHAESWTITVFLPEQNLSCLTATGEGEASLNTALAPQD